MIAGLSLDTVLTTAAVLMIGVGALGFGSVLVRGAATGLKRRERLTSDAGRSGAATSHHGAAAFAQLTDKIRKLGGAAETQYPDQASALKV